jgi:hypothetical protein
MGNGTRGVRGAEVAKLCRHANSARQQTQPDGAPAMLWTILIILVIIALALFIFGRLRGRR